MDREQLIRRALENIGKEAMQRLRVTISTPINGKPLNASGYLRNSMESKVIGNTVQIYMAKYAMDVEEGLDRKPNKKPSRGFVSDIQQWMAFKGITPEGGRTSLQSARAIAQSIYDKGTIKRLNYNGAKFIQRAVYNAASQFTSSLAEAFIVDLEKELNKISKTNG